MQLGSRSTRDEPTVEPSGGAQRERSRKPSYQPMVLLVLAAIAGVLTDRLLDPPWWLSLATAWSALLAWWLVSSKASPWHGDGAAQSPSDVEMCAKIASQNWASHLLLLAVLGIFAFWHHGMWNWFGRHDVGRFASDVAVPCSLEAIVVTEPRTMSVESHESNGFGAEVRTRLGLSVRKIRDGKQWIAATGKADLIIHAAAEHLQAGDRVRLHGKLIAATPPSNPGQFDFQRYHRSRRTLASLHVYHAESAEVIVPSNVWSFKLLSRLRRTLNEMTWRYVGEDEAPFASAVMLGNREQMTRGRKDAFLETGTVHLLAISGLHVGILAGAFFLLFRVGFVSRDRALWLTIAFAFFYAWLVEFRPPVLRAAILITMFCIGRLAGEKCFSFNLLAIAGCVVLALNPTDLFGLGPQLSFLAVATLTFGSSWVFWPPSSDPIKRLVANTRPAHVRLFYWLGRQTRTACLVSGLIWLVALPLVAYQFHLVAPISLAVNPLLLMPIAWALYGGLGVLTSGWVSPTLARGFGWFCEKNLALIEWIVTVAQSVPGGHWWTPGPTWLALIVFYAGLFLAVVFPPTRQKGSTVVGLGVAWFICGWWLPDQVSQWGRTDLQPLVCTFVDVGHGSGVLLQTPAGKAVLCDAGSFGAADYGARNIAGVLWSERISHLDAIVLSHADVDHFNAVPQLLKQFSVGCIYVPPQMVTGDSDAARLLFEMIDARDIPVKVVVSGDQIDVDRQVAIDVLGPPPGGTGENDNSNSVVLSVASHGRRLLLPGDLERSGLERLLGSPPVNFDVVMAPHHGSDHSAPERVMRWSQPEVVVISGGNQRVSDATAARFAGPDRVVYRTGKDGAVRVVLSPEGDKTTPASIRSRSWKRTPW